MAVNPPIPFIDLARFTKTIRSEVLRDWEGCLDRCEFVGGPGIAELEKRLCDTLKAPHALACANGTDALILGLQALGVKRGMKVALPNLTFWATYEAIVQIGAVPVLIDIDSDLQMDFPEFKSAHEKHRFDSAILVHLMGWASHRLAEFRAYCSEQRISLLEDGAQCFGVEVGGRSVFEGAQMSTLSFYPAKVVGGAMDGGGVLARDSAQIDLARSLANHGRAAHYSYAHVGWNSRMSGLQARFLNHVVARAEEIVTSRLEGLSHYEELIPERVPQAKLHLPPAGIRGNGYLAVLTVPGRSGEEIAAALKKLGVGAGRVYPETLDQQPLCKNDLRASDLVKSRQFCREVFNLPLFYGITRDECEKSVNALVEALR